MPEIRPLALPHPNEMPMQTHAMYYMDAKAAIDGAHLD
jgi:hypothetical protein